MARGRPGPRLRDAVAGLGIGLVVVTAALVPAITAGVGGTTVIRGDVHVGADALPFYPVGFWSPTQGLGPTTTTDAAGRFSLDVPDGVDGFAYAGSAPDALDVVWSQDGRSLARGVIGEEAPRATSHPLYQGWSSATARNLGDGRDLAFHLQAAGRVAGTAPSTGGGRVPVELRRLDGSVVQRMSLDAAGRFASAPVAAGDYAIVSTPRSPYLPAATRITVRAGRTVDVTVPQPQQGATLSGLVTTLGRPVGGVPVLVVQSGEIVARKTSSATGTYSVSGLAAGTYTVSFGRTAISGAVVRDAQAVAIPGVTPSPTPTDTPAPTASPSVTDPTSGTTVVPVRQTVDALLPADTTLTIDAGLDPVLQNEDLDAAAVLSGHVTGAAGATVHVLAEDPATQQVVRAATASASGAYRLGGLTPGDPYLVVAATDPAGDDAGLAGQSSLTVTAAGSTVDVALAQSSGQVSGTVSGATGGTVRIGDPAGLLRTAAIGKDGAYRVAGLPPGTYPVVVAATGAIPSPPRLVRVSGAVVLALAAGARPAVFKAWYIASGAGVTRISGRAVDDAGDTVTIGPGTVGGTVTIRGLAPGTYRYDAASFVGSAPAFDGPWWYGAPLGGFTLRDGATTDAGPTALHVYTH